MASSTRSAASKPAMAPDFALLAPAMLVLASLAAVIACDSESQDDESETSDEIAGACDNETRAMTYSAGLEVQGDEGLLSASLMDASPAPPSRMINDWKIDLNLLGDGDLEDATLTVSPWMPDHGHGSAAPITVEPSDTGKLGSYDITGIDLFMAGYWEVHFDVQAADESWSERVTFGFCVE